MKTTIPNVDILKMHIVYHWILQVHSISCITEAYSCLVTASTPLNCCKAKLVTNCFNLVYLHIINIGTEVTNNWKIAATNRKMSTMELLQKKVFLANSKSLLLYLVQKSKISFLYWNWWAKTFHVFGDFSKSGLKLNDCKEISKA